MCHMICQISSWQFAILGYGKRGYSRTRDTLVVMARLSYVEPEIEAHSEVSDPRQARKEIIVDSINPQRAGSYLAPSDQGWLPRYDSANLWTCQRLCSTLNCFYKSSVQHFVCSTASRASMLGPKTMFAHVVRCCFNRM